MESPSSKEDDRHLTGKKKDRPDAEDTEAHIQPALDFEQIFSEETLAEDRKEELDEAECQEIGPTVSCAAADDSLEEQFEGEQGSEVAEEERVIASGMDREPQEGCALKDLEAFDSPFAGFASVPLRIEEDRTEMPNVGPFQDSNRVQQIRETDAWELVLDYLRLRHSEIRIRGELESVISRLDAVFDKLDSDTLKSSMGSIRRVRKNGGASTWVLTTAD